MPLQKRTTAPPRGGTRICPGPSASSSGTGFCGRQPSAGGPHRGGSQRRRPRPQRHQSPEPGAARCPRCDAAASPSGSSNSSARALRSSASVSAMGLRAAAASGSGDAGFNNSFSSHGKGCRTSTTREEFQEGEGVARKLQNCASSSSQWGGWCVLRGSTKSCSATRVSRSFSPLARISAHSAAPSSHRKMLSRADLSQQDGAGSAGIRSQLHSSALATRCGGVLHQFHKLTKKMFC
eukprot:CAMPEP_0180325836 /NCGR_PEP_ID=MMETSP0988-20121125/38649_1 /TAXON_ID=697907 /ORGANISM="non described non described, Strain CCMP2293" /LENGTH=236 /DNA_ID=CAMNT_0022312317 /DNA_START=556 /DNA_END=1263 /DNA_ORIENTATION=-